MRSLLAFVLVGALAANGAASQDTPDFGRIGARIISAAATPETLYVVNAKGQLSR